MRRDHTFIWQRGIEPIGTPFSFPWDSSVTLSERHRIAKVDRPSAHILPSAHITLGEAGSHPHMTARGSRQPGTPFPNQGIVPRAVKRRRIARMGRAPTLGSPDGALCGVMSGWGPGDGGEYRAPPTCKTPEAMVAGWAKWPGGWEG